ncbi:GNAT family N-acetyltransferase [Microbulbifer echini]|uniref:GNAT family N-acetyltransferase n=1 Tax=Microbulbifer echini TaxID=1529067 RepID=A0ABV4NKI7_9GAMM
MRLAITGNIHLTPLVEQDAQALFHLIEANRALLNKYLYWVKSVKDLDSTRQYIQQRIHSKRGGAVWYKIICDDTLSGIFGIKEINRQEKSAEIGYWLSAHCQGRGIMTNVVTTICEQLRNKWGILHLNIHCLSENTASIAVAKRAGGIHSDTIPAYSTIDGKSQDLMIYTISL